MLLQPDRNPDNRCVTYSHRFNPMIASTTRINSTIYIILFALCIFAGSCGGSAPRYTEPGFLSPAQSKKTGEIKPYFRDAKIMVDVFPQPGEGYIELALRLSHEPKRWHKLKQWNSSRPLQVGRKITVPFEYLNAAYRLQTIKQLFPKDRLGAAGWQHVVTFEGETMWFIAEVFCGAGERYPAIQKANGKKTGQPIALGEKIIIPAVILSEEFSADLPSHPELTFVRDESGKLFAEYTLKNGEALYSAVIVRFTGRIEPDEVNSMVGKILRVNRLSDPRRIPSGQKIRIPFEDLSDDFASSGAPDRVVTVDRERKSSKIYVILDAGHGGTDPGTMEGGLTEDEYAYDIVIRTKRELEKKGVKVFLTVADANDGLRPRNKARLINGKKERLKTTPNWHITDARVAVNLRVYLVNSLYRKLINQGVKPKNIYLISIHLDSLHPSIRGAMVYYPHAEMRKGQFKMDGSIYRRFKESRGKTIRFQARENRRAASYSYDFGREIIRTFRKKKMPVHRVRPIRWFVYRNNSKWAPAIIRYSKIPNSILLEVVNMSNAHDRALVKDYRFREKTARAITESIL